MGGVEVPSAHVLCSDQEQENHTQEEKTHRSLMTWWSFVQSPPCELCLKFSLIICMCFIGI